MVLYSSRTLSLCCLFSALLVSFGFGLGIESRNSGLLLFLFSQGSKGCASIPSCCVTKIWLGLQSSVLLLLFTLSDASWLPERVAFTLIDALCFKFFTAQGLNLF